MRQFEKILKSANKVLNKFLPQFNDNYLSFINFCRNHSFVVKLPVKNYQTKCSVTVDFITNLK